MAKQIHAYLFTTNFGAIIAATGRTRSHAKRKLEEIYGNLNENGVFNVKQSTLTIHQ